MGYYVKWKGYEEDSNTWVDEQDAGYAILRALTTMLTPLNNISNAEDLIKAYWLKVNKHPSKGGRKSLDPKPKASSSSAIAKSNRKSISKDTTSPEAESISTKKRGRKSKADTPMAMDEDEDDVAPIKKKSRSAMSNVGKSKREVDEKMDLAGPVGNMNKWMTTKSWEHIVDTIDTVENSPDGKLMVYFTL